MKVKIGPYKKWIGPYQIANMIPLIGEARRQIVGQWLASTWVADVCQWHYSRQKRKIEVHIDKWDTWSMDYTLAHIILPMLKQLRDDKHGSPYVDEEDLPAHMLHEGEDWVHYKWEWILNEMIWAFEQILDDDWESKFEHGVPNYVPELVEGYEDDDEESRLYSMKQTNPDYWVDYEGIKCYSDRIRNGTRLFGKYYQNLWD